MIVGVGYLCSLMLNHYVMVWRCGGRGHGECSRRCIMCHRRYGGGGAALVLRYSVRVAAPGCVAMVLEALSLQSPYSLENRTPHPLLYRPAPAPADAGVPPADFLALPPYSSVGYAPMVAGALHRVPPLAARDRFGWPPCSGAANRCSCVGAGGNARFRAACRFQVAGQCLTLGVAHVPPVFRPDLAASPAAPQ